MGAVFIAVLSSRVGRVRVSMVSIIVSVRVSDK